MGNHDKNLKNCTLFESISQIKNIRVNIGKAQYNIVLCHYPIASWENKTAKWYHAHGHTHGRHRNGGLSWDIGVDNLNYYPIEVKEFIKLVNKIKDGGKY